MKTWHCWALAVVLTLASAVWQRMTGPTYPAKGTAMIAGTRVAYSLLRTQITGKVIPVTVVVDDAQVRGEVAWRRYPTEERWERVPMTREGSRLSSRLPTQPMAGKIEYQVRLQEGGGPSVLVPERPAVARFRREVPAWVLVPHVLCMFLGMLVATRAGLEAAVRRPLICRHAAWALGLLVVGGFFLGPLVQEFAFDAWWTGVPFGWDLTDNKTLVAIVAWALAVWAAYRMRLGRRAVVAAAVITLVVYAIPHSVWGSQLDWNDSKPAPAADPGLG